MSSEKQKAMGFRQTVEAFILKTLNREVFCVGGGRGGEGGQLWKCPERPKDLRCGSDLVCLSVCLSYKEIQRNTNRYKESRSKVWLWDVSSTVYSEQCTVANPAKTNCIAALAMEKLEELEASRSWLSAGRSLGLLTSSFLSLVLGPCEPRAHPYDRQMHQMCTLTY